MAETGIDHDTLKQKIGENHLVRQLEMAGKKLLEETNRPNVITYAQFEPYITLFNADKVKLNEDQNYRREMQRLLENYRVNLGINFYEPTIVIMSETDRTEIAFLDRIFTRIRSDAVTGDSKRDSVPSVINKASPVNRDQLMVQASILDLIDANNTPEQRNFLARVKMESAIIQKHFSEKNLSSEKRTESLNVAAEEVSLTGSSDGSISFELDDD